MLIKELGPWIYLTGVLLSILGGIFEPQSYILSVTIGALGIMVGLLNITEEEVLKFLVASLAFIISSTYLGIVFEGLFPYWPALKHITDYFVIFMAPAAGIVSFKTLYYLAKD